MPADDIVAKTIPATGVVAISGRAEGFESASVVPVVNQLHAQLEQLRIHDRVRQAGPRIVLPEIEAAVAVRNGPAASIFPMVYHDLVRWIEERGYRPVAGPGRDVWVHEVDDIADVAQQVFEIQLPFTRPPAA